MAQFDSTGAGIFRFCTARRRVILPAAAEIARQIGKPFGASSEQVKKILGIFCLVMALVGGYRISKVLTTGEGDRPTGNSAYDAGRRTGMIAVPVVYALFGIWLITHNDVRVFSGGFIQFQDFHGGNTGSNPVSDFGLGPRTAMCLGASLLRTGQGPISV